VLLDARTRRAGSHHQKLVVVRHLRQLYDRAYHMGAMTTRPRPEPAAADEARRGPHARGAVAGWAVHRSGHLYAAVCGRFWQVVQVNRYVEPMLPSWMAWSAKAPRRVDGRPSVKAQ
jgi:hypothetical protein